MPLSRFLQSNSGNTSYHPPISVPNNWGCNISVPSKPKIPISEYMYLYFHMHSKIFINVYNLYTFADTLKEILRELDNKLTEDDINNIIEEVDEDGSGTLDFDGRHHNYDDDDDDYWGKISTVDHNDEMATRRKLTSL